MPRRCTICDHKERREIDRALVARSDSSRGIARNFGTSEDALYRHYAEHLPERLTKARDAREIADADSLLAEVRTLQKATRHILSRALTAEDHRTALGAIREARGNIELLGKLLGELQDAATVQVNVLASPEVRALQTVMFEALADFPDARAHVAGVLLTLGRTSYQWPQWRLAAP